MILPHVDAITSGIARGDIQLRVYTTQVIIGRVSTALRIANASNRHRLDIDPTQKRGIDI